LNITMAICLIFVGLSCKCLTNVLNCYTTTKQLKIIKVKFSTLKKKMIFIVISANCITILYQYTK